jgi:methylmalonyl-CoA mutase
VIPPERVRYLAEIVENSRAEDAASPGRARWRSDSTGSTAPPGAARSASRRPACCPSWRPPAVMRRPPAAVIAQALALRRGSSTPEPRRLLEEWPALVERYSADEFRYHVRDKVIEQPLVTSSLSGTRVPRVCLPRWRRLGRHPRAGS